MTDSREAVVVIKLSERDAHKLFEAFEQGMLKDFGLKDVKIHLPSDELARSTNWENMILNEVRKYSGPHHHRNE